MRFVFVFLTLFLVSYAYAKAQGIEEFNHEKYDKQIKKDRALKDVEMLTDEHSPIPEDEKAAFKKLNYYKPKVATSNLYDCSFFFLDFRSYAI